MLQKIKNNCAIILASCLIAILCVVQLLSILNTTPNYTTIVQKNTTDITKLFQTSPTSEMFNNEYFKLDLPTGMSLYAIENNNAKLRYNQTYIDVHVLTSQIDVNTYSMSHFPNSQKINLPTLHNQAAFLLVQEQGHDLVRVAVYSQQVELTMVVQKKQFEELFLKSLELLKNITVNVDDENEFFIGGNRDMNEMVEKSNNNIDVTNDEEDNKEMPVVKQ